MTKSAIGAFVGLLTALFMASMSYFGHVAFGGDPWVVNGLMHDADWWGIVAMAAVPLTLIGAIVVHTK